MEEEKRWLHSLHEEVLVFYILPYLDVTSLYQLLLTSQYLHDVVIIYLGLSHRLAFSRADVQRITERMLFALNTYTGNLRALDFSSFPPETVTNILLRCFIMKNPLLRIINITGCVCITSRCFGNLDMPRLEVLIANWCPKFDERCLDELARCPLQVLSVGGVPSISEGFLDRVNLYYPDLRCLNISNCYRVTDRALKRLRKLRYLECLQVSENMLIPEDVFDILNYRCMELREILVTDTRHGSLKRFHHQSSSYAFRREYAKMEHEVFAPYISKYLIHNNP